MVVGWAKDERNLALNNTRLFEGAASTNECRFGLSGGLTLVAGMLMSGFGVGVLRAAVIMIEHERYKQINNTGEYYFSIRSNFIEEDITFIKNNRISNIRLNDTYEFFERDLDKLEGVDVKRLYIQPFSNIKFSYSRLSEFTNLEYLVIQNGGPDYIDLSSNLNLRYILVANCTNLHGLQFLNKLESMVLTKPTLEHFSSETMKKLTCLKDVALYDTPIIHDFSFLHGTSLEHVTIYNAKQVDFSGVEFSSLRSLKIKKCKKFSNIENIFLLSSLVQLYIIDSFKLNSVKDLSALSNLEVLVVMGKSSILDGDFTPLYGRLRHFGFDDKRHYSVKCQKFKDNYLNKNRAR